MAVTQEYLRITDADIMDAYNRVDWPHIVVLLPRLLLNNKQKKDEKHKQKTIHEF
jgi:hypothetical protein